MSAFFFLGASALRARDSVVVFSEIHYNPADSLDDTEFVELHNLFGVDVDLGTWGLRGAVQFDFPAGTTIAAGGYLVVARDPIALQAATGYDAALGPWGGALNNGGEELLLVMDAIGPRTMDDVDYSDGGQWPWEADGSGASLEKIDARLPGNRPDSWSWSALPNGTPGAAPFPIDLPHISFNEIDAVNSPGFFIELANYGDTDLQFEGYQISSSVETRALVTLPPGILYAGSFTTINADMLGYTPIDEEKLFLLAPYGESIVAAIKAGNHPKARFSDGTGPFQRPVTTSPGVANSVVVETDVVINEILYHGYPNSGTAQVESDEEWIELYNKGKNVVDLGGWKFDDAVEYSFPIGTRLAPGSYLVVGNDPAELAVKYPGLTVLGPWSGRLSNADDRIVLEDQNGNTADEVHYFDGGRWPEFADGGGCSLELRDPWSDNACPENWSYSETYGNWQTYTYRAVAVDDGFGLNNFHEFVLGLFDSGEMLIDDISVIEDPDGAALEFVRNGDFTNDSLGHVPAYWRAAGNHGLHGRTGIVDDNGNKVLKVVATGYMREFHNQLQTTFANNEQVEPGQIYEISYRAKWLKGIDLVNTRLYFNWLSNTYRMPAARQWGTPGAPNSKWVGNTGPAFSHLSHFPVIPSAGRSVTVETRVSDPDGVASVALKYRVQDDNVFMSVPMTSQGDGRYRGTLPGFDGGTIVQFFVEAIDNHAMATATSFFPAAGPDSRAMIQWQDHQADTSVLHNLRIIMRPQDRKTLHTNIHRMSNYRFPATLVVDESEVYYDIGIRLKGSAYGRNKDASLGFNLGFDPMQPFYGVHQSISIERGSIQQQLFSKHLMCNSGKGMASMYDDPIRLVFPTDTLGNTSRTGLALLSPSRYGGAWRSSQLGNDDEGTLYNFELLYCPTTASGDWKNSFPYTTAPGEYEFADYPLGKETYRWGFQLRSNFGQDNYAPLINTARALAMGGPASVDELEKFIDVNQWARTWAYLGLIGMDDLYTRLHAHNFRMYHRPEDGLLVALPWDMDRCFRLSTSSSLIGDMNLGAYLNQPTVKRLFMQHVHQLCQTSFSAEYAGPWASHYAAKTGLSFGTQLNYINDRRLYAESQLPAMIPFAITSNGGNNFSVAASSVQIQGTGWIDVATIEVNGVLAAVEWIDDQRWQIPHTLDNGTNELTLTAYSLDGDPVGTDTITITRISQ